MLNFSSPFIYKTAATILVVWLLNSPAQAQLTSAVKDYSLTDTSGRFPEDFAAGNIKSVSVKPLINNQSLEDAELQQNLHAKISTGKERRQLMRQLRQLNFTDDAEINRSNRKFFYNLGNAFAQLRLYSLAMKCFFKTLQYNEAEVLNTEPATITTIDSIRTDTGMLVADTTLLDSQYLGFNLHDDSLMSRQDDGRLQLNRKEPKSPKVTYQRLLETFEDGKTAVAYAMLMHVKQPVAGKRKVHQFANSGHSFITLIKYNSDSTYTSVSFGFYPNKNQPFAGTPLFPSSPSAFKNDTEHNWDEVAGRFISKRRFNKILALTKKYDGIKYNLNTNNCTDFSLNAAHIADINVKETTGSWPLGHGNNPGITGQSILQGNVTTTDPAQQNSLFISHDIAIRQQKN